MLCTTSWASGFRFISSTEVGYAITTSLWNQPGGARSVIARMSWTDLKPAVVADVPGDVMDFAWSPDGSSLAYLLYTSAPGIGSGAGNQLWLKTGDAAPRALTPLIPLYGRGGSISDQILVRFSRDGKYLLMVDTFVSGPLPDSPEHASFQVRAMPAGNLVWVPPTALMYGDKIGWKFVTMAAWSRNSDRLYYRDLDGVHTWDPPRAVASMSPSLTWFSPSVSPDGRFIAYAVNMTDQPHVEVRDLVTNDVRVIRGPRGAPFFLANSQLFVAEYAPSTQQGPGVQAYSQTGKAFVIDLRTIVETGVPMMNPIDSWPR
jgi:WD40 repeat protein